MQKTDCEPTIDTFYLTWLGPVKNMLGTTACTYAAHAHQLARLKLHVLKKDTFHVSAMRMQCVPTNFCVPTN